MTKTHSASCLGYICTCDNCYRCEGIIKDLRAENARYREALELIASPMRSDGTYNRDRKACEELACEALKGGE